MYYPYKVVLTINNPDGSKIEYQDFGREQDESMFIKTAKRILHEMAGIKDDRIIAQKRIEYIPIEQIDKKYITSWPNGLKTIMAYYFEYNR